MQLKLGPKAARVSNLSLSNVNWKCAGVYDVDIGTDPHQVVADTFTLFRSGPADYSYHVRLSPACFESYLNGIPHISTRHWVIPVSQSICNVNLTLGLCFICHNSSMKLQKCTLVWPCESHEKWISSSIYWGSGPGFCSGFAVQ